MFSQFFRTLSIQIDISGYINASKHKRLSPDVQQILPNTSRVCVCIYIYICIDVIFYYATTFGTALLT